MGAVEFGKAGGEGEATHQGAEVFGGLAEEAHDEVELLGLGPFDLAGDRGEMPGMDALGFLEAEAEIFGELPLGAVHVEGGVGVGE